MPIYEYVCPDCDFKFEMLRPLSKSGEAAVCPECRHNAGRVPSTFACFSADESGMTAPVGGNSCASCATANCASCGM